MILRPLRWLLRLLVVFVALVGLLLAVLWITNPKPQTRSGWERLHDMPDPRGEVAAAIRGRGLIVAGGLTGFGSTSRAVSIYDVEKDRWQRGRPLPEPRHHAAAAAGFGTVCVSGGAGSATDWTPLTSVWCTSLGEAWEEAEAMPEGRQGHAMVALERGHVVVGGVGDSDRTMIYDPFSKRWSFGAPLPNGRDHLRAVAWRERVWALGGRAGGDVVRRVDVYDPRRDTWRRGPDLPEPMSAMAVGVLDDALHVIGGEDPDLLGGVSNKHFVLELGSDRWTEAPAPILAVHGGAFGVWRDRLIVAGGASRQGALSTISWTGVAQSFEPRGVRGE